jgi:hypothetical protein
VNGKEPCLMCHAYPIKVPSSLWCDMLCVHTTCGIFKWHDT